MCGIAGIVAFSDAFRPGEDGLRAMCETVRHRGPDEGSVDIRNGVGLGVRRLAVIDPERGSQPLFNEDRTVRAIFNGEIYNYRELRRQLEERGHRFDSGSDGEVIPHLWEEHARSAGGPGPGAAGHDRDGFPAGLNGMFAIAVHDAGRRRLTLVRDRIGVKPLYYYRTPDVLLFGSEVKALLASGVVDRQLDLDALGQFLSWEYVPAPRTLMRGVRKLEPGTLLDVDLTDGSARLRTWWDLPRPGAIASGAGFSRSPAIPAVGERGRGDGGTASATALATSAPPRPASVPGSAPTRERSASEWAELVDHRLATAVRRQLVSDVPLGAFLSGGVDSSLVVAHMGDARTFSLGFEEESYSELEWARRVADHLDVRHRVEVLPTSAADMFDDLMHYMDDPIGDFSIFPTYLISRLAREEVTVALSGDGGDELFGGYETYVAQEIARAWERLPSLVRGGLRRGIAEPVLDRLGPRPQKKGLVNKAKRFTEGLRHPAELGHARWRLFLGEAVRRELFTPEARAELRTPVGGHITRLFDAAGDRSDIDRALYVDLKSYLSDNCLVKVDRMSMACSLEARVPFLDHELVETAFRVPARLKVRGGRTKVLLKRIAAEHVPRECVYRPKQGFSFPLKHWLRDRFRPLVGELLEDGRIESEGIFRPETVRRLVREHMAAEANHSHLLWSLIVFQDWRRRWGA